MVITKEQLLKYKSQLARIEGHILLKKINRRGYEQLSCPKPKISERLGKGNKPFRVVGTALSEGKYQGLSGNTNFYPSGTLQEGMESLIGKPIIWDHDDKKTKSIVGKVIDVWMEGTLLKYEGEIYDQHAIDLLSNNLVKYVSAGFDFDKDYIGNIPTVTELEFKELSLVVIPSCEDANIEPK